jgi:hypothetical protein
MRPSLKGLLLTNSARIEGSRITRSGEVLMNIEQLAPFARGQIAESGMAAALCSAR